MDPQFQYELITNEFTFKDILALNFTHYITVVKGIKESCVLVGIRHQRVFRRT